MRERPPSNTTVSERSVSLVVLGTGHGSSMVYGGVCSAAYVLCVDKDPVLLIGAGYGVVQQCLKYFGRIPSDVFVSSNRSHVAAELPVVLAREANRRGEPLRLLGHSSVLQRIESHRLAELHDVMATRADGIETLVQMCHVPPLQQDDEYEHANGIVLQDAPGISVRSFATATSEASAGVAVYCSHSGGARLFAVCGDSRDPRMLFQKFNLDKFHVVVLDGRKEHSTDHGSFEEIFSLEDDASFHMHVGEPQEPSRSPLQRWFIGHYGGVEDAPTLLGRRSRIQPVVEGSVIHTRLLVSLRMHEEVGNRRFVNAEHHGNSVTVEEVRVTVVRDTSVASPPSHSDPTKNLVIPPDKKKIVSTHESEDVGQRGAVWKEAPRAASPGVLSRLQKSTQSSSLRRSASASRQAHSASRRSLSAQRSRHHTVAASEESSASDALVVPPKRVYLFTNEDKRAPGRMLMAQMYRNVQQLKQRAAEVLNMKPIGELHVMPSGEVVASLEQLTHGCSVVVTKGGGERFHMHRLPQALSMLPRTVSQGAAVQPARASPSPPRVASLLGAKPRSPSRALVSSNSLRTSSRSRLHEDDGRDVQFHEYMAQAAAILSSEHRQVSLMSPKDARPVGGLDWTGAVIAGSLPQVMSQRSVASSEASDLEDIFGNKASPAAMAALPLGQSIPSALRAPLVDVHSDGAATIASSRRSSVASKRMVFTMVS
jgi:hypothetical protein